MVLAGEGLAVVLALAPGAGERWSRFGVVSLATQWVLLFTLVVPGAGAVWLPWWVLARYDPTAIPAAWPALA